MKHIFIVNPHAGKQSCEALVRTSVAPYQQDYDIEIYVKQHRGDSYEVVRRYRDLYPDEELRFYACGGDGTLREVAYALMGLDGVAFTSFACGSGNDYVKYYGGPDRFRQVKPLLDGTLDRIDMMTVNDNAPGSYGPDKVYAMNATHFGLDYRVAATMNRLRRHRLLGGSLCYPASVAEAFVGGMRTRCRVYADGELLNPSGELLLCTVAHGICVGGSYHCAPRSSNSDGLLEVCLVHPVSRLRFLTLMSAYQHGTHLDDPRFSRYIVYRQARHVVIEGGDDFGVSLDGELYLSPTVDVRVVPQTLSFIVPNEE